eukprot:1547589-Rhodomonas_salina.1
MSSASAQRSSSRLASSIALILSFCTSVIGVNSSRSSTLTPVIPSFQRVLTSTLGPSFTAA